MQHAELGPVSESTRHYGCLPYDYRTMPTVTKPDLRKKSVRLEVRWSPITHALVRRAANLQGRSVSDFVVTAIRQAAEEAIREHDVVVLSLADQKRFAAGLSKQPTLAPALRRAARDHRKLLLST